MNIKLMKIKLRQLNAYPIEFDDVVELEVVPVDPENRTQAERNAQNALDAARLARVEAHLGQLRAALAGLPGTSKVLVEPVLAKLDEALEARVS